MPGPMPPEEYGDWYASDEKLREAGWAAGLDVWAALRKVYSDALGDDELANAQLWSLKQAVLAEERERLAQAFEELANDVDSGMGSYGAVRYAVPRALRGETDTFRPAVHDLIRRISGR